MTSGLSTLATFYFVKIISCTEKKKLKSVVCNSFLAIIYRSVSLSMSTRTKEVMQEFVEGLKETYTERQLSCEEQWPPVSVEKLFQLQLVETDKKEGFRAGLPQHGAPDDKVKRTPILHGDLFKAEEGKKPVRKLIVEGNAGIGKTTLCTMLTEEWANGKIFTQFDCVLLLPLRDQLVSSASSLSDLLPLYHPDETVCGSVVQQLKRTRGKGVLIIADGWDELSEEKRSKNSFIYNLLFGRLLPAAGVLLTSRPSASAPLHNLPTVDCLVEVVGFNEQNIQQFIESEFEKCPDKASSLIEQLENNPVIQSVCSVPLNCAIICYLWHTFEGGLPTTLTELYAHIVLNVILRNLKKANPVTSPIALGSFDDIPTVYQEMFWLTCAFAYNCLSEDRLVFTESKVASTLPQVLDSSDKFLCLGLLQCARSLLPVGQGLSFHFVHLTIQEFLAALHLVTLPNEEKLKVCKAHAESSRFAMVWRFVFGLGCKKEKSYSRKVVCLNDDVVDQFFGIKNDHDVSVSRRLMFCHCSMESLDDTVFSKTVNLINGQFEGYLSTSIACTPQDCVAVFHVLRRTLFCSGMILSLDDCGLNEKLLKNLADILLSAGSNLQVKELSISGKKLTDKGIADLLCRASASLSSLERLLFSFTQSSSGTVDIIPLLSSFHCLTDLFVSDSPLGVSGIQSLETAIQASTFIDLESLSLSNTLTDDADINGALLATLLPTIASHSPHLKYLDLSKNTLGVPGASAVGELITIIRSELRLVLRDTNINAKAVAALFPSSRHSEPCFLSDLNLSKNPKVCDGLEVIFRMLKSRSCLFDTTLFLAYVDLTTSVTTESQYHNILLPNTLNVLNLGPSFESRLTSLYLYNNNFSGDKVFILAECMRVCLSLKYLYCWNCCLTSNEVTALLDHLKHSGVSHKNLRWWDLSDNSIDDDGVNALIESTPKLFPSLELVPLEGNPMSDEVEKRLRETLPSLLLVSMRQNLLYS